LSIHPPGADIGWPRVAASFEFQRALRFEEEFDVVLRVAAMTPKTMTYVCVLQQGDTRIASGARTIACVRKRPDQPMQAIAIPADIAGRFQVHHESSQS